MSWHPNLWHPFTQVAGADPPLRAVGGQGALLELDDGRLLIDAISSWWVTLHGHGEATIAAAIAAQARQLEQVIFANFSHPTAETLASQLAASAAWSACSSPITAPPPWRWPSKSPGSGGTTARREGRGRPASS